MRTARLTIITARYSSFISNVHITPLIGLDIYNSEQDRRSPRDGLSPVLIAIAIPCFTSSDCY